MSTGVDAFHVTEGGQNTCKLLSKVLTLVDKGTHVIKLLTE